MGDYTKYLRLIKPGGNDYYNVDDFNQNSELIDKETEKLNNAVTKIQEGATREKAGIVQFGTEKGKALEGMMLARLAGCIGYGGDIQDEGVKDVNYLYYDRNTRKMYKCINQNNDISANVNNFKPLDNNSLDENMNKLAVLVQKNISDKGYFIVTIYKLSNILIITVSSTGKKDIIRLETDSCSILNYRVVEAVSSITGNYGSAGQLYITSNRVHVEGTGSSQPLSHSFMGQIITTII